VSLSSGDAFNGIWTCNITIPQDTTPGAWRWDEATVYDSAGNRFHHRTADLQALGFPTQLDVTYGGPGGDTNPPELIDFDFNPKSVDVSAGAQTVLVTVESIDVGSGVKRVDLAFDSPSGSQRQNGWTVFPSSGDASNGTWTISMSFPTGSEPGTWLVEYVVIVDEAGNRLDLQAADLQALGFPTQLDVIYGPP
jgi:hypothetical protein